jgi:hypothetical protein
MGAAKLFPSGASATIQRRASLNRKAVIMRDCYRT